MSSYEIKALDKKTGHLVRIMALDDYFGKHEYGYRAPDNTVYREKEFNERYEAK